MSDFTFRAGLLGALTAGLVACSSEAPSEGVEQQAQSIVTPCWSMASSDFNATGNALLEHKINAKNAGSLEVKWIFDAQRAGGVVGPVHGTPVAANNVLYFGTALGQFYAVDRDGNMLWSYMTRAPNPTIAAMFGLPNTPVIGAAALPDWSNAVIFGDLDGNIYALDRATGAELWAKDMNPHPIGGVVGNSILVVGNTVVIGMASLENSATSVPGYQCCSHVGFVVALDANTGAERWRYTTMPPAQPLNGAFGPQFAFGPSGADIWGQPTYDWETHTIYFGTGQNFSPKPARKPPYSTDSSDAVIAVDASTGRQKWKRQLTTGDIWVNGMPNPNTVDPVTGQPPSPYSRVGWLDMDVGDSPRIYRLGKRKVVGFGQKTGEYYVLDAATGAVVKRTKHVEPGNSLGGFQAGGALTWDTALQHGLDKVGDGTWAGTLMGLSLDGTQMKWRFDRFMSAFAAPIATANGVVYTVSPTDERAIDPALPPEWALFAVDAKTGAVLLRKAFPGRSLGGPIVNNGRVYVGKGNLAVTQYGIDFNGGIVALGLPDE